MMPIKAQRRLLIIKEYTPNPKYARIIPTIPEIIIGIEVATNIFLKFKSRCRILIWIEFIELKIIRGIVNLIKKTRSTSEEKKLEINGEET